MDHSPPTRRTQLKRLPKRGVYDKAAVHAILDEGLICHVGFTHDGQNYAVIGVLHQGVKRIGACRHTEAGDVEIGLSLERGGGVRSGAPYRIGRILRYHGAISKDLTAAHGRRGVTMCPLLWCNCR